MKHSIIIAFFLTFLCSKNYAQFEKQNHWGLGINYGITIPFTDIKRHVFLPSMEAPIISLTSGKGVSGFFFPSSNFSIEAEYNQSNFIGYSYKKNLDYKTVSHIINLSINYWSKPVKTFISSPHYFSIRNPLRIHNFRLIPYLGLSFIRTKTKVKQTKENENGNGNQSYFDSEITHANIIGIPVGTKILFQISRLKPIIPAFNENIHFFINTSLTYTFSDKLDGYNNFLLKTIIC